MGNEKGFSLVELMIVCVVLVIVAAIAIPNIAQMNASYKLDTAGHAVASLLQDARMQAVKTNQPVYANYNANGMVYLNGDPTLAYANGNPDVALPGGLAFQVAPPDASQLTTYLGGAAQIPASMAFNARGLPCIPTANPAICPSATTGFEWFIQNSRGGWEAITVTPSGRIKTWRLSSVSGGVAAWQ